MTTLAPDLIVPPPGWKPSDFGGIGSTEDASDWLAEADGLSEVRAMTPRREKLLRSFAALGAGRLPRGGAGSFASYDAIVNALTLGQAYPFDFYKIAPSASQGIAGLWQSLWTATGTPGAGSAPAGTPGAATSDTVGGMTFPAPGGGQNKFAVSFGAVANQNCVLAVSDRLCGVGAVTTASTGSKTISSAAISRYSSNTTALNNEAWMEETTASSATAAILRLDSYTSGDGTAAQDAVASLTTPAAATVATWAGKFPLKAGKPGIQAASTWNVGTASTSGAANFVISRPLFYLPLVSSVWNERDLVLQLLALPQIFDAATLDFKILAPSGVTTTVWGNLRLVYG